VGGFLLALMRDVLREFGISRLTDLSYEQLAYADKKWCHNDFSDELACRHGEAADCVQVETASRGKDDRN
jgi:hypothetical protein